MNCPPSQRVGSVAASVALVALLSGCVSLPYPGGEWQTAVPVDEWPEPEALPRGECPWTSDTASQPAPEGDPTAMTEAVALDETQFWALIESIPAAPVEADFQAMASDLGGCTLTDVVAFQARLTLALYALDGPENMAWYEENDPSGLGFVSEDLFLYARCAAVLGGRASWEAAVAQQTLDWGDDAPDTYGYAELLLYVALDAAVAQGVTVDDYYDAVGSAVAISFETGSNTDRWG